MTGVARILNGLKKLNGIDKVRGSMAISPDGMIISSDMNIDIDPERLSALCSSVGLSIKRSFDKMNIEPFSRYIINSDKWKLYIVNTEKSYLITITDLDINIASLNTEIYQVLDMINKMSRLE